MIKDRLIYQKNMCLYAHYNALAHSAILCCWLADIKSIRFLFCSLYSFKLAHVHTLFCPFYPLFTCATIDYHMAGCVLAVASTIAARLIWRLATDTTDLKTDGIYFVLRCKILSPVLFRNTVCVCIK